MKKLTVRHYNFNYFVLHIRNREVLHLRPTLSTGKMQLFQLPFCKHIGLNTFSTYDFAQIEDGNERTKIITKDLVIFPHHYDEEEPDYDEEEMEPTTGNAQWVNVTTTWTTT